MVAQRKRNNPADKYMRVIRFTHVHISCVLSQANLDLKNFQMYLEPVKTSNASTKAAHVRNVRKFMGCLEFEGRTMDWVAIACDGF